MFVCCVLYARYYKLVMVRGMVGYPAGDNVEVFDCGCNNVRRE